MEPIAYVASENGAAFFEGLIRLIGEDPCRKGLEDTPIRAWKAFKALTAGYEQDMETVVGNALFPCEDSKSCVWVRNIEFFSVCEHHLLPFLGKCHVAYIPNGFVLGLSKVARIVDMYARRLQMQERLTQEIANGLKQVLGISSVAVAMEATHLCMMARGVQKKNAAMLTYALGGEFESIPARRSEFFSILGQKESLGC